MDLGAPKSVFKDPVSAWGVHPRTWVAKIRWRDDILFALSLSPCKYQPTMVSKRCEMDFVHSTCTAWACFSIKRQGGNSISSHWCPFIRLAESRRVCLYLTPSPQKRKDNTSNGGFPVDFPLNRHTGTISCTINKRHTQMALTSVCLKCTHAHAIFSKRIPDE